MTAAVPASKLRAGLRLNSLKTMVIGKGGISVAKGDIPAGRVWDRDDEAHASGQVRDRSRV